jgi:integrase
MVGAADRLRRTAGRIKGAGQEMSPERPVLTVLTVPQVYALADAADERYRTLVLLAAFTSLRWGKPAALRRSDIDIPARTVRVARQLHERHGAGSCSARRSPRPVSASW